jgi:hypothetical protein
MADTPRRHITMGERNIDRQRELVAWLERKDSQEAKRMLALYGELQNLQIAGRDLSEKELAEISK